MSDCRINSLAACPDIPWCHFIPLFPLREHRQHLTHILKENTLKCWSEAHPLSYHLVITCSSRNLFAKKWSGQAPVTEHNFILNFAQVFNMILGWQVKSWGLHPKYYTSLKKYQKTPNPNTPNLKQNADSAIITMRILSKICQFTLLQSQDAPSQLQIPSSSSKTHNLIHHKVAVLVIQIIKLL